MSSTCFETAGFRILVDVPLSSVSEDIELSASEAQSLRESPEELSTCWIDLPQDDDIACKRGEERHKGVGAILVTSPSGFFGVPHLLHRLYKQARGAGEVPPDHRRSGSADLHSDDAECPAAKRPKRNEQQQLELPLGRGNDAGVGRVSPELLRVPPVDTRALLKLPKVYLTEPVYRVGMIMLAEMIRERVNTENKDMISESDIRYGRLLQQSMRVFEAELLPFLVRFVTFREKVVLNVLQKNQDEDQPSSTCKPTATKDGVAAGGNSHPCPPQITISPHASGVGIGGCFWVLQCFDFRCALVRKYRREDWQVVEVPSSSSTPTAGRVVKRRVRARPLDCEALDRAGVILADSTAPFFNAEQHCEALDEFVEGVGVAQKEFVTAQVAGGNMINPPCDPTRLGYLEMPATEAEGGERDDEDKDESAKLNYLEMTLDLDGTELLHLDAMVDRLDDAGLEIPILVTGRLARFLKKDMESYLDFMHMDHTLEVIGGMFLSSFKECEDGTITRGAPANSSRTNITDLYFRSFVEDAQEEGKLMLRERGTVWLPAKYFYMYLRIPMIEDALTPDPVAATAARLVSHRLAAAIMQSSDESVTRDGTHWDSRTVVGRSSENVPTTTSKGQRRAMQQRVLDMKIVCMQPQRARYPNEEAESHSLPASTGVQNDQHKEEAEIQIGGALVLTAKSVERYMVCRAADREGSGIKDSEPAQARSKFVIEVDMA